MGGAVAYLKALLGMDAASYKAGTKDAENATTKLQKKIKDIGKTIAAAFTVRALWQYTRAVVDFASEIRHASDNLRVSTDELQAMNAEALRYGLSIDEIQRGLSKMLIAQDGVARGEKIYTDALKALNVSQREFVNASPARALEIIGRAYGRATDQAAAFAGVADLVGQRIGPRLIAFVTALGQEGLETIIARSKEAGTALQEDLITRLEELGTQYDTVGLKAKVFWAEQVIGVDKTASAIKANMTDFKKWIEVAGKMAMGDTVGAAYAMMERPPSAPEQPKPSPATPPAGETPADRMEREQQEKEAQEAWKARGKFEQDRRKIREDYAGRIADLQQKAAEQRTTASMPGQLARDSLAQVGGMIGADRASGISRAEKQLKLAQENNDLHRQVVKLQQAQYDALRDLELTQKGGVK